jgi:hypothetical protein
MMGHFTSDLRSNCPNEPSERMFNTNSSSAIALLAVCHSFQATNKSNRGIRLAHA